LSKNNKKTDYALQPRSNMPKPRVLLPMPKVLCRN